MTTSEYTVSELASIAGVSVRTLHHYDQIGLLTPVERTRAGYRLYGREELLRLQQILFYRELGFGLSEIRATIDRPDFDRVRALKRHRKALRGRVKRLRALMETVDNTIALLQGEKEMLTDRELYKGFDKVHVESIKGEAAARWGEEYRAVDQEVRKMSPERWKQIQDEGEQINRDLAALVQADPGSAEVQLVVSRHHAWLEHFYPVEDDRYLGLAEMYVADERFKAHYDAYARGLAEFLAAAMRAYVNKGATD